MSRMTLLYPLFVGTVLAGALPAAAELDELPFRIPLDVDAVVLELWSADVDVEVDPEAGTFLRAAPEDEDAGPLNLDLVVDGGILTVRRPAATGDRPLRIRLSMAVTPAQAVSLAGRDMAVTVRDGRTAEEQASGDEELPPDGAEASAAGELSAAEEAASAGEAGAAADPGAGRAAGPAVLRFALESSQVDFAGIRNAVVEAKRTSVWMTRTSGIFAVTLDRGSAEIRGHQGDLQLDATASEVSAYELRGHLTPHLAGGSLDVRQGTGVFDGTATDAVLVFDGWHGYVTLRAEGATVEGREVGEPRPWNLDGIDLLVSLEKIAGPITANLDGGRFKAVAMDGRVAVTAGNRADVVLDRLSRGADLNLSGGSTARLTDVSGQIKTELQDAELRALRAGTLLLSGARSTVEASAVDRLAQVEMTDSDLVLDLTSSTSSSFLKLLGTGRAAVRLAAPCIVRISGPAAPAVDVSGCELRLPGQPERSAGARLVYGDRRPVMLTVSLDDGVELEVEGLP